MEFIKLKLFYNKFLGGRMYSNENTEVINPVMKIIREYEMIEKAELAHYNFQKEQKKRKKIRKEILYLFQKSGHSKTQHAA